MKLEKVDRALVVAMSTALIGCSVLAGCGSDSKSPAATAPANCGGKSDLTAEGSTAQENAIKVFVKTWATVCPGKNLTYNPTGSGSGREQFIANHVDFAGSDSPLSGDQVAAAAKRCSGNPAWNLPLVFGPVALAYHIEGVNSLAVNADVLAKIFSGIITDWSDPALVALNPGVDLPQAKISPIYRSDSSGTTDNFQKYLAAAAPNSWNKPTGSEFQGGVGEGAQTSAGLIEAVQSTPGAIGYVEKSFADESGVPYAAINTGSGAVPLTENAAREAIDNAKFAGPGDDLKLDLNSLYGTKAPGAYPLVLATYEIVCSKGYDAATSAAVKSFLSAAANNGQSGLATAGYVGLPNRFKQRLATSINAIK